MIRIVIVFYVSFGTDFRVFVIAHFEASTDALQRDNENGCVISAREKARFIRPATMSLFALLKRKRSDTLFELPSEMRMTDTRCYRSTYSTATPAVREKKRTVDASRPSSWVVGRECAHPRKVHPRASIRMLRKNYELHGLSGK